MTGMLRKILVAIDGSDTGIWVSVPRELPGKLAGC